MTKELAAPPTRRRRLAAGLAGTGLYFLVLVTAAVLPSALANVALPIGVVAGILVAGGLTPALTIRDWVIAGILVLGFVALVYLVFVVILIWTWTPDVALPVS
jgi:hypothetical protein